ncbi:MAG: hypothetical protein IJU64_03625 [Bacilli bacterium]|nr:hypothetical protein [Bacilli bacterium]
MGGKIGFLLVALVLCSCGSQEPRDDSALYPLPSYSFTSASELKEQAIAAKGLPEKEREEKGQELFGKIRELGYFKPMGQAYTMRKLRFFDTLCADSRFEMERYRLSQAVAVDRPISKVDYEASFSGGFRSRTDLSSFARARGYLQSDSVGVMEPWVDAACSYDFMDFGSDNAYSGYFYFNANRGLFRFDGSGAAIPDLASDVSVSEDRLTYTITISENYWKDHAGTPLRKISAEDFVASFEYAKRSEAGADPRILSFEAKNEATLVVKTNTPDTHFVWAFSSLLNYPCPADFRVNPDYGKTIESTVYSGNYRIEAKDRYLSLVTDKEDALKEIRIYKTSTDASFENGELDVRATATSEQGDDLIPVRVASTQYLALDFRQIDVEHKKAMENPYFRRAVLSVFDRNEFSTFTDLQPNPLFSPSDRPNPLYPSYLENKGPWDDDDLSWGRRHFLKAKEELPSGFFNTPAYLKIYYESFERVVPDYIRNWETRLRTVFGNEVLFDIGFIMAGDFIAGVLPGPVYRAYCFAPQEDLLETVQTVAETGFALWAPYRMPPKRG